MSEMDEYSYDRKKITEYSYEAIMERLYDLDRMSLRRIAWEALLMSDGPDHVEGDVKNANISVAIDKETRMGLDENLKGSSRTRYSFQVKEKGENW